MFRSFSPVVNLILHRSLFCHHHLRYATNLSSSKSIPDAAQTSSTDKNEWLWEYLRHRQSYQALNDEQKRQVIQLE